MGMHHPSQASKGAFFQKATAIQVKPHGAGADIVTAYLKVKLDPSKKPRVLANPHGITGRNGVGVIVATVLYGTHTHLVLLSTLRGVRMRQTVDGSYCTTRSPIG